MTWSILALLLCVALSQSLIEQIAELISQEILGEVQNITADILNLDRYQQKEDQQVTMARSSRRRKYNNTAVNQTQDQHYDHVDGEDQLQETAYVGENYPFYPQWALVDYKPRHRHRSLRYKRLPWHGAREGGRNWGRRRLRWQRAHRASGRSRFWMRHS
jgi:hypothetical protein